jgi:hypothetical protein
VGTTLTHKRVQPIELSNCWLKKIRMDKSLVSSVVIDAELGRRTTVRLPAAAIERRLVSLDVKTDPKIKLNR